MRVMKPFRERISTRGSLECHSKTVRDQNLNTSVRFDNGLYHHCQI